LSVIIWRGFGILVPFIIAPILALVQGALYLLSNNKEPFKEFPWTMPLGFAVGGVATFAVGLLLEKRQKQKEAASPEEDYLFEPNDVFMFIRFKYWGFIWLGLALFAYLRLSGTIS